jgi:hypothetical protein
MILADAPVTSKRPDGSVLICSTYLGDTGAIPAHGAPSRRMGGVEISFHPTAPATWVRLITRPAP